MATSRDQMLYNNHERKHKRWYSSKDSETYGSRGRERCHMTDYGWDSQFCEGLPFLECVTSGILYNNNNFLLHFSVFWYDRHKSLHHPLVFNKILLGWQLHQVIEIHQRFRDWFRLHPLSAQEDFIEFCDCKNFKTDIHECLIWTRRFTRKEKVAKHIMK
jgi:hypothetical protein